MIKQLIESADIKTLSGIGVYSIYHVDKPNCEYIGSTSSTKVKRVSHRGFYRRFYDHLRKLTVGKHHCGYLQNVVRKYGVEGIRFKILELCEGMSTKQVRDREQFYIDHLKPQYNSNNTVYPKGRKWTYQERKKQSSKMLGQPLPNFVYERFKRPVCQFREDGSLVAEYTSIKEARSATGVDRASISKCAAGLRKSAGGYKWKYK